jgi:hypothetical protein
MASITKDDIWKAFTVLLSVLIVPLAGWVWSMNTKVTNLQNDLGDVESAFSVIEVRLTELENFERQSIGLEKDIEHMRDALKRIEELVTR